MSLDSLDSQRRFLESIPTGLSESTSGISPVRRFFCLIAFFDFLLTSILWITSVVTGGQSIEDVFWSEIFKYSISTSLFDLVIGAGVRFILLIIAYGCFKCRHWFIVALTTITSVVFIITKLFYYEWDKHSNSMLEIIFLLSSLFLSFVEAWFLDYKVVNEELRSAAFIRNLYTDVGRTSVLGSAHLRKFLEEGREGTLYYSDHSHVSDEDDNYIVSFTPEQRSWKTQGEEIIQSTLDLLNSNDWSQDEHTDQITIYSKRSRIWGRIYKLVSCLDHDFNLVYHEVFYNFKSSPKWNTSVATCHIVETIDNKTDIVYYASKPSSVGSMVAKRDFVILRHCKPTQNGRLISMVSAEHPKQPPKENYIRAEHGPSAFYIKPFPGDPSKTCIEWLFCVDLKLSAIVKSVAEQMIPKELKQYVLSLNDYLKECKLQAV